MKEDTESIDMAAPTTQREKDNVDIEKDSKEPPIVNEEKEEDTKTNESILKDIKILNIESQNIAEESKPKRTKKPLKKEVTAPKKSKTSKLATPDTTPMDVESKVDGKEFVGKFSIIK